MSDADLAEALRSAAVLGADLDLTLIDTRAATAYALREANRVVGVAIDVDDVVGRLGPPLRDELARYVPGDRIEDTVREFRAAFLGDGLRHLTPLPGAVELADTLHRRRVSLVVITSRIPPVAQACLRACGLTATTLVGDVSGEGKAPAMRAHDVALYLGDHPLDMAGARAAGVPGVGVCTGAHTGDELRLAGAAWVVADLRTVVAALSTSERP